MIPKVGQQIDHEKLGACIIRRVYRAGTIDIEQVGTGNWFRITGLMFVSKEDE